MSHATASANGTKSRLSDAAAARLFLRVAAGEPAPNGIHLPPELADGLLVIEDGVRDGDGDKGIRDFLQNLRVRDPGRAEEFTLALQVAEADAAIGAQEGAVPSEERDGTETNPPDFMKPETRVRCLDRDPPNFGNVIQDRGDRIAVHFESPSGRVQDKVLPRHQVERADETTNPAGSPDLEVGENGWPTPREIALPQAKPFPIDVFPAPAADFVREGAEAIGCAPDFLALDVLGGAAGTIGRTVRLRLKSNYFAGSSMFAAKIGPPSDGKTPSGKAASEPIRRIDANLEVAHEEAMKQWKEESEKAGPDGKKPKGPTTPPPKPDRIDIDDATMEVIPILLSDNPRGLYMGRDELAALVMGLNQYKAGGKGSDRAVLLKIWSGDAIKKDRVGHANHEPIRCPHPCLTIIGGMTPDMLGEMADPKGRADGFVDRFLFCYPESRPIPEWSDRGITEETADAWDRLVRRLWARSMEISESGRLVPHVAHFTPEAKSLWIQHYNGLAAEMNTPDFPPHLRGVWGKLREYAGRLALVLACMHHAADYRLDAGGIPSVDDWIVGAAWQLVDYFKSHALRVHAAIATGHKSAGGTATRAIVEWIKEGRRTSFTLSEIKQARRWIKDDELTKALAHLVQQGLIRAKNSGSTRPKGGRPTSTGYEVNPALLETRNPRNPENDPESVVEGADGDGF